MNTDMFEKVDFHIHTNVSDGTVSPTEMLRVVKENGIELFAVTDHDAVRGCEVIIAQRKADDPHFLTGIEFSCKDEDGKYHILGYGYDPYSEPIREIVRKGHVLRMQKVQERLDLLQKTYGFRFPDPEIRDLFSHENPGKPHIGLMMTKLGFTASKEEAIRNFINKVRVHSRYIRPEEAISAILKGGGIPVLAHPIYGSGEELFLGEEMEARLRKLLAFGIQGVEAYYSGFPPMMTEELLMYADRYGLYVTAGSDFHGMNKLVPIGDTNAARVSEAHPALRRFINAVSDRIY